MIDVFILTAVTSRYLEKRSRNKTQIDVASDDQQTIGPGDDLYIKVGGKKDSEYKHILIVFFFFLFLRVALYFPVNYHVRDFALGVTGGIAKIDYVDHVQQNILNLGGPLFTSLFPIWVPISVGLNLWNQLDEDFPQKQLIKMHKEKCYEERDFRSCGIYLELNYGEKSPETFNEKAFNLKELMVEEKQICEIYGFIQMNYQSHWMLDMALHYEKEMCELEICQSDCKYLKYRSEK